MPAQRDKRSHHKDEPKIHPASKAITKPTSAPKFSPYSLVLEDSWKRRILTPQQEQRQRQISLSNVEMYPDTEFVWFNNPANSAGPSPYEPQVKKKDPWVGQDTSKAPSSEKKKTSNSFIVYRSNVQRIFSGSQSEISRDVGALWRGETNEMRLHCQRIAAMKKACTISLLNGADISF